MNEDMNDDGISKRDTTDSSLNISDLDQNSSIESTDLVSMTFDSLDSDPNTVDDQIKETANTLQENIRALQQSIYDQNNGIVNALNRHQNEGTEEESPGGGSNQDLESDHEEEDKPIPINSIPRNLKSTKSEDPELDKNEEHKTDSNSAEIDISENGELTVFHGQSAQQMTRKEMMEEIESLKNQLYETRDQMNALNARIIFKEETMSKTKSEFQDMINDLEQELEGQEVHLEHYEQNEEDHLREIELLRITNKELVDQLEEMRHSLDDVSNIREKLESDLAMKENTSYTEAQESRSLIESLEKSNEALMEQNDSLKKELSELRVHVQEIEMQLTGKTSLCKTLEKELKHLKMQNEVKNDLENARNGMIGKMNAFKEENESLKQELEEIKKSKEKWSKKAKHYKSSMEKMKSITTEFDEFCGVLSALNRTLQKQKESASGQIGIIGLQQQQGALKGETFNKSVLMLKEILSDFNEQQQSMKAQIVSFREKDSIQNQKLNVLMEQKQDLQSKYDEISKEREESEATKELRCTSLEKERDDLSVRHEALQNELKILETKLQDAAEQQGMVRTLELEFEEYRDVMESKVSALNKERDQNEIENVPKVDRECGTDSNHSMEELYESTRSTMTREQMEEEFAERSQEYEREIAGLRVNNHDIQQSLRSLLSEHEELFTEYDELRNSQHISIQDDQSISVLMDTEFEAHCALQRALRGNDEDDYKEREDGSGAKSRDPSRAKLLRKQMDVTNEFESITAPRKKSKRKREKKSVHTNAVDDDWKENGYGDQFSNARVQALQRKLNVMKAKIDQLRFTPARYYIDMTEL